MNDDDHVMYVCDTHLRDAILIVVTADDTEAHVLPHPWSEERREIQWRHMDREASQSN